MELKLLSEHKDNQSICEYAKEKALSPDKDSEFGKKWYIQIIAKVIPAKVFIFLMIHALRYDGFIAEEDGQIVGHLFFQRHSNELHCFSIYTREDFRGNDIGTFSTFRFITHAIRRKEIQKVRISKGAHSDVKKIIDKCAKHFYSQITVKEEGWIELNQNTS